MCARGRVTMTGTETETETKVKPSSLNQMTFCFDRGTKRKTPLKGKYR